MASEVASRETRHQGEIRIRPRGGISLDSTSSSGRGTSHFAWIVVALLSPPCEPKPHHAGPAIATQDVISYKYGIFYDHLCIIPNAFMILVRQSITLIYYRKRLFACATSLNVSYLMVG